MSEQEKFFHTMNWLIDIFLDGLGVLLSIGIVVVLAIAALKVYDWWTAHRN